MEKESSKVNYMKDYLALCLDMQKVKFERLKGHNYTYINLNSIIQLSLPVLNKHGFIFTTLVDGDHMKGVLTHILTHKTIETTVPLKIAEGPKYSQALGSGITYSRRYSLIMLLNIAPDKDDDGLANSCPKEQGLAELRKGYSEDTKKFNFFLKDNDMKVSDLSKDNLDLSEINDLIIMWGEYGRE